jgi:hypothetical protein
MPCLLAPGSTDELGEQQGCWGEDHEAGLGGHGGSPCGFGSPVWSDVGSIAGGGQVLVRHGLGGRTGDAPGELTDSGAQRHGSTASVIRARTSSSPASPCSYLRGSAVPGVAIPNLGVACIGSPEGSLIEGT